MADKTSGACFAPGSQGYAPEPATPSQPNGADPSRFQPEQAYVLGTIDERKAIARFMMVRASRAAINYAALPWWALRKRMQHHWAAVGHILAAKEIEEGAHVTDQAVWLVNIEDGVIIGREAFKRDKDASLAEDATAAEPRSGGSLGPQDIAHPSSEQSS